MVLIYKFPKFTTIHSHSANKNKCLRSICFFQSFTEIHCSLIIHIIEHLFLFICLGNTMRFTCRMKYHIIMTVNWWHLLRHINLDVITICQTNGVDIIRLFQNRENIISQET